MFLGHLGVALAARKVEPELPLGATVHILATGPSVILPQCANDEFLNPDTGEVGLHARQTSLSPLLIPGRLVLKDQAAPGRGPRGTPSLGVRGQRTKGVTEDDQSGPASWMVPLLLQLRSRPL